MNEAKLVRMKSEEVNLYGFPKANFSTARDTISDVFQRFPERKILLLSDERGVSCVAPFFGYRRAVSAVQGTDDVLSLFAMPDGIACCVAVGKENVLKAARCYSMVQRIPCVCLPVSGTFEGLFAPFGEVSVGRERRLYSLREAEIVLDRELLKESLADAYARLLLARLACAERVALRIFTGEYSDGEKSEALFYAVRGLPCDESELLTANLNARLLEAQGAFTGEGEAFARMLSKNGEREANWKAFRILFALYLAFFQKGKPRRYAVPDYFKTGTYGHVPTAEEYAKRALILEGSRARLCEELSDLSDRRWEIARTYRSLGGRDGALPPLKTTFESLKKSTGLSSVIRDFGLLENLNLE